MTFSPEILLPQLVTQPGVSGWQVAYSGGMDSHVLLRAMARLRDQLGVCVGAVHVHHGLQLQADDWEVHCRQACAQLGIDFVALHVDACPAGGDSPEAAARHARYAALADWLPANHCLLTAQHRDDQAETLLLQLLRGAGVHGIASMPTRVTFGQGTHLRPLLNISRADLQVWAHAERLDWVDDPSNAETGYDRNYLRHHVMPVLQSRWPAVSASLYRSAGHAAEAARLLDELALQDRQTLDDTHDGTLSLAGLSALPSARQRNVLRHWMKQQAGQAPATAVLLRVVEDVLGSRVDAKPCVRWGMHEVRRYRDKLFVLPVVSPAAEPPAGWSLREPLVLPGAGILSASRATGRGLRDVTAAQGVQIRWRQGGEACQPVGRNHHHPLKKLFQEQGIPPWERDRLPLLFVGDQLVAVAGLWVCEPFQAAPDEAGYRIHWQPGQP